MSSIIFYLKLARLSNSPTVVSNVLVGSALAGIPTPNSTVFLLIVAMIAFYSAGVYLNDILDLKYDCKHNSDRLLPKRIVTPLQVTAVMTTLFGLGGIILWTFGNQVFLMGLALIALIVVYNLWHKNNPVSPLLMASCRVMVYIIAFVSFSKTFTNGLVFASLFLMAYIIGLSYVAKKGIGDNIIVRLIAGISLYDAFVLSILGSISEAILAILCFITTLYLQRYIKGT